MREDCHPKQDLRVDLDHDGAPDRLLWTRCGPPEAKWLPDGKLAYPVDALDLTTASRPFRIYTNRLEPELEFLSEVTPLREGTSDARVLVRSTGYGTGNMQSWEVLDVAGGDLRRLQDPTPIEVVDSFLRTGESIRKPYENGVRIHPDGTLETGLLIYRTDDANCCPTGGLLRSRLKLASDRLVVLATWREPLPEEPEP